MIFLLYFISVLLQVAFCEDLGHKSYNGYKIVEVIPKTESELKDLSEFHRQHGEYEFLSEMLLINGTARIVTSPVDVENLIKFLEYKEMFYEIVNEDLGETIQKLNEANEITRIKRQFPIHRQKQNLYFNKYHLNQEIISYLKALKKKYPKRVAVTLLGLSYKARQINLIRISNGVANANKRTIIIDAGIHPREWIAPETALYAIHQLVENYNENAHLLEKYDFIIVPLVNPDGHEYTHSLRGDRLWRKTLRPNQNKKCPGTDANRNFSYKWGLETNNKDECKETYPGPNPFSEVEADNIRKLLSNNKNSCTLYMSLHSFGRYIFFPWFWDRDLIKDFHNMNAVAQAGKKVAKEQFNQNYMSGSPAKIFKRTSGTSTDFAYGVANIPLVFIIELPSNRNAFDPPQEDILKFVQEGWAVIKAMAEKAQEIY